MSKLTTLLSTKYLCTLGSIGPSYQCSSCIWHTFHNSRACAAVTKAQIHHMTPLRELADIL